jgi:hypothetical protein
MAGVVKSLFMAGEPNPWQCMSWRSRNPVTPIHDKRLGSTYGSLGINRIASTAEIVLKGPPGINSSI